MASLNNKCAVLFILWIPCTKKELALHQSSPQFGVAVHMHNMVDNMTGYGGIARCLVPFPTQLKEPGTRLHHK